jgi:ABC-type nitrate/sulfonate/bicarbonate transport system substrate-binding protein
LVACLAASQSSSHGECRTHEMLINAGANPISAYVEAQTRAAEWLAQHPELAQQSLIIHPGRAA